jgi:hypothetical protein
MTLPRGCPRVELRLNEDRSQERDPDALKSRRGERMIFEDAGRAARSRQVQAKDLLALSLISCLVQPYGCNPEMKKAAQTKGRGQQVPRETTRKKRRIFYGDILSIDVRGHLAVRDRLPLEWKRLPPAETTKAPTPQALESSHATDLARDLPHTDRARTITRTGNGRE